MQRFPVGGETDRGFLRIKRQKDDPLSLKGMGVAQKVCTGSGQTRLKNGEFTSRRPSYASNGVTGRLGQTGTGRGPQGTFSKRQQRRSPPSNDRAELDGPHLRLPVERYTIERSE